MFLDNEKAVLKKLEKVYKDALIEIESKITYLLGREDADLSHVIYQIEYQNALKKQVEVIIETLHNNEFETLSEYLTKSYEDGFIGVMYDLQNQGIPLIMPLDQALIVAAIQHETKLSESLYAALGKDTKELSNKISGEISRGLATGQMFSEIARNIANWARIPKNNAMRIARTEAHRIQCTAAMNACENAKSKGADVVKQWDASLDNKTRKSHMKVDGEIRELDEPFSNGLMFPGDPSGKAKEVINCRCALLQRARWALSEDELNTLKERAEYYGLDKNKNFEKYKEKYLKAVENDGKSSTIKADKVISGHSSTPKKAKANSIIDHVKDDGTVDARGFYGNDGMKQKDIHTTNHGNPKQHDYGKHGEHGHDYEWDENGSLKNKTTRELSEHERKENGDIL